MSKGAQFRQLVANESPLQIVGAINAYCAMMAEKSGFKALYISGAGVANASYGLPDLGITNLTDVLTDVWRITNATDLPVLVDVDTGFGHEFGIDRMVVEMIKAGVAAIQIEDQQDQKRCGHRPGKRLVSLEEMVKRVRVAVNAKTDPDFVIMARTDALAVEGMDSAVARAKAYVAAGADMIFAEAITELEQYQYFVEQVQVPVLANITEFGKTPLFTVDELHSVGVAMVLYPLSAFRAMNKAALNVYQTILQQGSQQSVVDSMQTRNELYEYLDYLQYEQRQDKGANNE